MIVLSLLQSLKNILQNKDSNRDKYVSREFQKYGYDLAEKLGDPTHVSLYIKLAQTVDRQILERAWSFVADANARNKPALFMWKMKQLKQECKKVIAKQIVFSGFVQGVFFRDFVKSNADKFGVKGYVKNLSDGTVEAILEEEEKTIDKLIEKCRKGTKAARVESVKIENIPVKPYVNFEIEY